MELLGLLKHTISGEFPGFETGAYPNSTRDSYGLNLNKQIDFAMGTKSF